MNIIQKQKPAKGPCPEPFAGIAVSFPVLLLPVCSTAMAPHEPVFAHVVGFLQGVGHTAEQFPTLRTVGIFNLLLTGFCRKHSITFFARYQICNLHRMTPNTLCMLYGRFLAAVQYSITTPAVFPWILGPIRRGPSVRQIPGPRFASLLLLGLCGLTEPRCAGPVRPDPSRRRNLLAGSYIPGQNFPWGWRPNPG